MSNVLEFKRQEFNRVSDLLAEAADKQFSAVWVIGIKDRTVHLSVSGSESMVMDLGIIEALKDHMLKNWV